MSTTLLQSSIGSQRSATTIALEGFGGACSTATLLRSSSTTTVRSSMCKSLKSLRKFRFENPLFFWVRGVPGRKNRCKGEICSSGAVRCKSLKSLTKEAVRRVRSRSFAKSLKSLDIFAGNSGQGSASLQPLEVFLAPHHFSGVPSCSCLYINNSISLAKVKRNESNDFKGLAKKIFFPKSLFLKRTFRLHYIKSVLY